MSLIHFKLFLRHFIKLKAYFSINIIGLAIGFMAYIMVSLYIQYEKSWDTHNVNFNRIYRAQRHFVMDFRSRDGNNISPHSVGRTAKLITLACPEVEKTVIVKEIRSVYLSNGNNHIIYDITGCYIDPTVFDVFTYPLLRGNPKTALAEPYSIVLSQTMANKLFPNSEALGKTVLADKKISYRVTGIYTDLPKNTHYRPNYLVSMTTIEDQEKVHDNLAGWYMTYVLLKEGTDFRDVNKKIYDLFKGQDKQTEKAKIALCPLSKLHLSFNDRPDYFLVLFLYYLIGILILLLSAINYINLTTANATARIRETVVHKIHGGNKWAISLQFIFEAVIVSLVSTIIALIAADQLLIPFNRIIDQDLVLFSANKIPFILQTMGITLFIGVLSGIYPAFFLVRNNISQLLKNNLYSGGNRIFSFRTLLVAFQFTASIFLIITTIYISSQIRFVLNKNLGFDKNNLLYVRINSSQKNLVFDDIKTWILRHPEINTVSVSKHIPFISFGGGTINWEGSRPDEETSIRDNRISYGFFGTLGIQVIEGRDFSPDYPGDASDKCIINETAQQTFGWQNPIGKHLNNNRWQVIGVVKDFHFKDMHNAIEPAIFYLKTGTIEGDWTFTFRISNADFGLASKLITNEFQRIFPNDPFEVKILDDGFRNENTMHIYRSVYKTFVFFTVLLVILAAIGLLGLVSFTVRQKTKEIGIRKINGCGSLEIFKMLNIELVSVVLISSVFAVIAATWIISRFPGTYHCPFEWWMIAMGIGIVLFIVLIVSFHQTLKAAFTNPVEALRYE
jgi:putative ABC transport system permease protein